MRRGGGWAGGGGERDDRLAGGVREVEMEMEMEMGREIDAFWAKWRYEAYLILCVHMYIVEEKQIESLESHSILDFVKNTLLARET